MQKTIPEHLRDLRATPFPQTSRKNGNMIDDDYEKIKREIVFEKAAKAIKEDPKNWIKQLEDIGFECLKMVTVMKKNSKNTWHCRNHEQNFT